MKKRKTIEKFKFFDDIDKDQRDREVYNSVVFNKLDIKEIKKLVKSLYAVGLMIIVLVILILVLLIG